MFPFLPYLLQDLWDIGTSPKTVLDLIERHNIIGAEDFKVLDLGSGKGAVSVHIAKNFEIKVYGIDAMEPFVDEAKKWAEKYEVNNLCRFEVADIRDIVEKGIEYDLVIFGAVSPVVVFGSYERAISKLSNCTKPGGYLLIDDCYIDDASDYEDERMCSHSYIVDIFNRNGLEIAEELVPEDSDDINNMYTSLIRFRAELKKKHPELSHLFDGYVKNQEVECDILANKVVCVVWLLKKDK